MKLWRLVRSDRLALDGSGTERFGGRYSSPGRPVVNFASEPGLAVLIALRYLSDGAVSDDVNYVLGWTEIEAVPERAPPMLSDEERRSFFDLWLEAGRSLLAAVPSRVLPEGDIILMNPWHPDASSVLPLFTRPFSFSECLHRPPMLEAYPGDGERSV